MQILWIYAIKEGNRYERGENGIERGRDERRKDLRAGVVNGKSFLGREEL